MTDYKSPLNRNQLISMESDPIRGSNPIATLFWIIVFGLLGIALLREFVQAVEKENIIRETYYSQPATLRPAAYRKASPSHEQMWAMDHLNNVSRVAHAERYQP